jgi:uncharacterized protein (TIGR01440 family)
MFLDMQNMQEQLIDCLTDLKEASDLGTGSWLVVGASTSEMIGERIGTHTSLAVGRMVAETVLEFVRHCGCHVAFQCCEHLNRALVVQKPEAIKKGWIEVSAIPVPGAGGAVAAWAYELLPNSCLVNEITADAGIDIGDTLIGMHLKRVAVPVRGRLKQIGLAHVTMAKTRPPLIGGVRGVYDAKVAEQRLMMEQ